MVFLYTAWFGLMSLVGVNKYLPIASFMVLLWGEVSTFHNPGETCLHTKVPLLALKAQQRTRYRLSNLYIFLMELRFTISYVIENTVLKSNLSKPS